MSSVPAPETVSPGQVYRNTKKNTLYKVILLATDSDSDINVVVYQDVASERYFTRALEAFVGDRVVDGVAVKRFVLEANHGQQ